MAICAPKSVDYGAYMKRESPWNTDRTKSLDHVADLIDSGCVRGSPDGRGKLWARMPFGCVSERAVHGEPSGRGKNELLMEGELSRHPVDLSAGCLFSTPAEGVAFS